MKKLFSKNKKLRLVFLKLNNKYFILKSIVKNNYLFKHINYNASLKLKTLNFSSNLIVNRCIKSFNKKQFNKFTLFSRFIYLKVIRKGEISGFEKSNW